MRLCGEGTRLIVSRITSTFLSFFREEGDPTSTSIECWFVVAASLHTFTMPSCMAAVAFFLLGGYCNVILQRRTWPAPRWRTLKYNRTKSERRLILENLLWKLSASIPLIIVIMVSGKVGHKEPLYALICIFSCLPGRKSQGDRA